VDAPSDKQLALELQEELQGLLVERGPQLTSPLVLANLSLRGRPPDTEVIVIMGSPSRPGCTFGYRARIWEEGLRSFGPSRLATYLWLNIEEIVEAIEMGLPKECPNDGIVWLGEET